MNLILSNLKGDSLQYTFYDLGLDGIFGSQFLNFWRNWLEGSMVKSKKVIFLPNNKHELSPLNISSLSLWENT